MAFRIYEFENSDLCEDSLVETLTGLIKDYTSQKGFINLAFSGGKSPINLFVKLSKADLNWQKCNISLVDERILPQSHADSNAGRVEKYFLQNKAKLAQFNPLIKNFNENLNSNDFVESANSFYQQPDLAVLGMGLDGHTASLFPKAKEFANALKCVQNIVLINPTEAPYQRLSMSLNALQSCKKLFLFIVGKDKKEIFDRASLKENADFPISFILHSRKVQCDVYYSK